MSGDGLERELRTDKECSRSRRTVDVARILQCAEIDIVLECVEGVLHAAIQLQRNTARETDIVRQLDRQIEERGGALQHVVSRVGHIVRHEHRTREGAIDRNVEVAHGAGIQTNITIVVGRAQHTLLGGDSLIFAPRYGGAVAAALEDVTSRE